jgi:hypothetical protein
MLPDQLPRVCSETLENILAICKVASRDNNEPTSHRKTCNSLTAELRRPDKSGCSRQGIGKPRNAGISL